jgi:hypothetical protein
MANFDDLRLSVEALSGGTNTVKLDDIGMPSIMFVLPKYLSSQLNSNLGATVHPAWKVNNAEKNKVFISKYQNIVMNGRAYSLPMQGPAHSINWDNALAACRAKGELWGLTPMALWGAIALWCKTNGFMPRGNNNYGADVGYPHEKGVEVANDGATPPKTQRTATGSGLVMPVMPFIGVFIITMEFAATLPFVPGSTAFTSTLAVPPTSMSVSLTTAYSMAAVPPVAGTAKMKPAGIVVPGVPVTSTYPDAGFAALRVSPTSAAWRSSHSPYAHMGCMSLMVSISSNSSSSAFSLAVGLVKSQGKPPCVSSMSSGSISIILLWIVSLSWPSIHAGGTKSGLAMFSPPYVV